MTLGAIVASARLLATPVSPAAPSLIIVGVETDANRYHDMTPPPLDGPERVYAAAGGAPKFARFLAAELLPYIAQHYRTAPYTIVAGHSLSGLFVAYAYGYDPDTFNAAIAISPSLHWNGGVAYRQVLDGIRARRTAGRLYVTASQDESLTIDSVTARLAEDLQHDSGRTTAFEYRRLAGDSHANTILQGSIDGVRFVFRPISLAGHPIEKLAQKTSQDVSTAIVSAYDSMAVHYAAASNEFGLPAPLPFMFGYHLSQWLTDDKSLRPAGTAICRAITASHPSQWLGYHCLGNALRLSGDLAGAELAYRRGLQLARQTGDDGGIRQTETGLRTTAEAARKRPP